MRLMHGLLFFLATALWSFSSSPAFAADLSAVIATLEKDYNALTDVQAAFTQKTTIASIKREERGKGELFIKKGSGAEAMFRFDYEKPRQQIISDGKQVWYYMPDNKQVMVSDLKALFAGGNGMALNYLTGLGHVSRDFKISFAKEARDKSGNYVLDLAPKKPNQVMTMLRLTVSARAVEQYLESGEPLALFPIVRSEMEDHYGNRTIIEFSRVRVNQGLSRSRFGFKIPKGVEVIKNK